ncbi:MAG: hypothetical protein AABW87_02285 [Nanoarchaeota archaeon]
MKEYVVIGLVLVILVLSIGNSFQINSIKGEIGSGSGASVAGSYSQPSSSAAGQGQAPAGGLPAMVGGC